MKNYLPILLFLIFSTTLFGKNLEKKARKIHEKCLTIDTHTDTPWSLLEKDYNIRQRHNSEQSRIDFPKMKEGGLDAVFFAVFTPQKRRSAENIEATYLKANELIDSTYSTCKKNNDLAGIALSSDDAKRLEKQGKRAIYIGMENGFPIGTDISRVEEFYNKGVRYITLCHSKNNDICDSSSDLEEAEHNGLSNFGKDVVIEMNRLGMLIDVSHSSDKTFYDVINESKVPVIASHSCVRAIANHDRNMSDDMIKKLAENGGVIQICMVDMFVSQQDTSSIRYKKDMEFFKIYMDKYEDMTDQEKDEFSAAHAAMRKKYTKEISTISQFVDHIDYVKNLVGVDYVGIGSDFDGGGFLADCEDVSQLPKITEELLRRGYTSKEIKKIWGGNFMRVFKEVEAARIN